MYMPNLGHVNFTCDHCAGVSGLLKEEKAVSDRKLTCVGVAERIKLRCLVTLGVKFKLGKKIKYLKTSFQYTISIFLRMNF